MLSLKSLSVACALGTTVLMGCTTHSADLKNTEKPSKTSVSLQSHHWELQQALTAHSAPDNQWKVPSSNDGSARAIGLNFSADQRINVDRLCNSIMGSYSTQGEQIKISRLAATMMACSNTALMQLEQNVAQQLPKAKTWKITDGPAPILELKFEGGASWQLKGTPTHETLYGNSQRIFLEVAPQKVACSHPLMPNAQCMRVREIQYNGQGIKQSVGEWQNYYGSIEGYQHQAGVRNVLRIKRFTRDQVPADASKYIDVLDMAVESEIVR